MKKIPDWVDLDLAFDDVSFDIVVRGVKLTLKPNWFHHWLGSADKERRVFVVKETTCGSILGISGYVCEVKDQKGKEILCLCSKSKSEYKKQYHYQSIDFSKIFGWCYLDEIEDEKEFPI